MLIPNTFYKSAKFLAKSDSDLFDVIIFGSFVKGKSKPGDIDILLLFENKINKSLEKSFRENLSSYSLDVNSLTLEEFRDDSFLAKEGILLEGISLLRKEKISAEQGFFSVAFVNYSLEEVTGSKRTRFYYALNGRNDSIGFMNSISAKRFSQNSLIFPYNKIDEVKSFFEFWDIKIDMIPSLIPTRLKHLLFKK